MASTPLTSLGRRSSLEHADVGASREDRAFGPDQQGSEWGLLRRSHRASQVFDELLAEQVQRGIHQGEYPESARGLEAHLFIHHCLLQSTASDYPTNTTLPKGRSSIRWRSASAASPNR